MPSKRRLSEQIKAKKSSTTKPPKRAQPTLKPEHLRGAGKNRSPRAAAATSGRRSATSGAGRWLGSENDQRYRALFDQTCEGIALFDVETGQIVDCNPEFENLIGRSPKQLEKLKLWELVAGEEVELARRKFHEIKKKAASRSEQFDLHKPDGEIVPVEFVSSLVTIQGKQYIRSTVRDITESKRAEAALEKLARDLGERVSELNCLYGTAQLIETPGISLDEILQGIVNLIPPAWRYSEITCARVVLEQKVFSTRNFEQTTWSQRSDIRVHGRLVGTLEVYYLEKRPESDEGPFLREERNLINAIAQRLGRVIERRQAQEALEKSEKKYREFTDSLPQIVFEIDKTGKFTFINLKALQNYGYTKEDLDRGLDVLQVVAPEDFERVKKDIARALRGDKLTREEYTALSRDGGRFPIAVHSTPVIHENKVTGIRGVVVDITELKRAERAVEESERKHRTLVEQSLQGIAVVQDFGIRFANTAFARMSGYTIEELLSLSPDELKPLVHPEDQALAWGRYSDRLSGKEVPPRYEFRLIRKDGSVRWVELFSSAIEFHGRPAIQAALVDITDRKEAREALEEINMRLQALLDHTHMMVAYLDPQFNFVKVNRAYAQADEHDPSFFPGKNHFDLYPNKENERIFRQVVETGKPHLTHAKPFEYADHPERGVTYWDWGLVPIKDLTGAVTGLVLTVLNVTERKRAEERLEWELAVNSALAELSAALITPKSSIEDIASIVLDAAKSLTQSEHGFVSSIDPKTADQVAHTLTQMMGKQCLVRGSDRRIRFPIGPQGRYPALWGYALNTQMAFLTNSPGTHEASRGIPEGHIPITRFLAVPAIIDQELVGLVALANSPRDYTDGELEAIKRLAQLYAMAVQRRRTEEEIRKLNQNLKSRAAELAAANKELEAFSYSVSHDLRAPLRAVDGFSRILDEDYGSKLDEPAREYLGRVRAATQRMAQLIDDLLNLSLVIRRELHREKINLSQLAHKITEEIHNNQPERRIEFIIQDEVFGNGDPRLLRDVLENLLSNAWKFTGKRSRAKVKFGTVNRQGQQIYFVRDNGAGFDMKYADKLFVPFQRLHSTDEFSGNGIGLAVVFRIINRHGGRIWAEGQVEKGATFYFTLP